MISDDYDHVDSHYHWHDVWLWGISLAMSSIVLSSVGLTMQRAAHLRDQRQETQHRCPRKALFLIGSVLYIVAAVPDVVAYALLPQAIVSNIACTRLVLVAVLSHLCLDERISCTALVGILLCISGTALCLNFGPEPDMHLDKTPLGFFTPSIAVYLATGAVVLTLLTVLEHLGKSMNTNLVYAQNVGLPIATSLAYGLEKVFNTAVGFAPHEFWAAPKWLAVYAAIAGLGILDFYLNLRGVKRLPMQIFVPAVFATTTSICYFQSICIFREMANLTLLDFALSLGGMLMSLFGAMCIRPLPSTDQWQFPASTPASTLLSTANGDGIVSTADAEVTQPEPSHAVNS